MAARPFSQKIGEFLDWLEVHHDVKLVEHPYASDQAIVHNQGWLDLIYEFFDVDRVKFEQEKLAMLEMIRGANDAG